MTRLGRLRAPVRVLYHVVFNTPFRRELYRVWVERRVCLDCRIGPGLCDDHYQRLRSLLRSVGVAPSPDDAEA